jgi:hypothetical protein
MVWALLVGKQSAALDELYKVYDSDTAVAIIGASLLDRSLDDVLRARMRTQEGTLDVNKQLFDVNRPLGNLEPKIYLGYQLYAFERVTRNTMIGIARIRNIFAHEMDVTFSSDTKAMKENTGKLKLHEGRTHYPRPMPFNGEIAQYELDKIENNKDLFLVNLKLCLIELFKDNNRHQAYCNFPINWGPTFDQGDLDERLP